MKVRERSSQVRPARWDRIPEDLIHDAYKQPGQAPAVASCPACHAVLLKGRWQWRAVPPGAKALMCPACHRVADHVPAAQLTLDGAFQQAHRDEILGLVRHREALMRESHPMERIMATQAQADRITITTTGFHLARDIGSAVHHAYRGKLEIDYPDADETLYVHWHRA
ncbi:BCAM0308 family protein [Cupriavidus sp. YAF13]|uniref:BCAM0308 family protein n=1 Tax=Cupriavidus sp. YAF13 TaxID=3233075 RepID=UPI003F90A9A6